MSTQTGASLVSQIPSFQAVSVYSPASELDLRAMGALGAHLPAGFEARLTVALRQPGEGSDELAALARELENAYQAAIPEVTKAVQARAQQVALGVAFGQMGGQELSAAAAELERFGVYGPRVQERTNIVKHLAAQGAMGHAQRIAADFLRRMRSADDARLPGADGVTAGASLSGSQRRMPDEWVLHAYKQASGAKSSDRGDSARPQTPPAPSPQPDSSNFYERIGAAKEMSAEEIKTAYRKAGMLYHPDKHSNEGAAVVKKMTKDFQSIQEAYATLGDPKKRAAYDITLAKTAPIQPKASSWRPWDWGDSGASKR